MRLGAVERQQSQTIVNASGRPVLNIGLIPGSDPAQFGLECVDPSTGLTVGYIGIDSSDTMAIHIYNPSGVEEVRLGDQGSGIWGLSVLGPGGTLQQQAGVVADTVESLLTVTTSASAFINLGGPSVTCTIGPSGQALVTINSYAALGTASALTASVGVDGSLTPPTGAPYLINTSPNSGALTLSAQTVVSGLSAGSHTFQEIFYQYDTTSFSQNTIVVQPL